MQSAEAASPLRRTWSELREHERKELIDLLDTDIEGFMEELEEDNPSRRQREPLHRRIDLYRAAVGHLRGDAKWTPPPPRT